MSNFLGLPYHPSDRLLHWTDKQEDTIKLREAWDKIPQDLWPYVNILIEKSYNQAKLEDADNEAGEGL